MLFGFARTVTANTARKSRVERLGITPVLTAEDGVCLLYTSEGEIRKNIINADLVDCIVAMPTQLFYTTQIPVSLWFLAKNKKQKGKTLFIDARKLGTMVTRKLRELTDEDIRCV